MITDPRVFDDHHLPRELPHRDAEIGALSRALEPTLSGHPGDNTLVAGPSGVGKTALTKHTIQRLQRKASIDATYCRCVGKTTGDILRTVLRDHRAAPDPPGNQPVDKLHAQLGDAVDRPYVVVLDETDGLPSGAAVDYLLQVSKLSVIAICHDPDPWLAQRSGRVRHALTPVIHMDRYTTAELADILEERARHGLGRGAVDRDQLERIADEVAGVARYGIQALRAAAELADQRGHRQIQSEDIDECFERAQHLIRRSNLQSLTWHYHVLYGIVHEAGTIAGGDLHERYEQIKDAVYQDRAETPISERDRRNKLQKLVDYDLLIAEGNTRARCYTVADETITSQFDPTQVPV